MEKQRSEPMQCHTVCMPPVVNKPTLAEALKPLIKQVSVPKGPSMAAAITVALLAVISGIAVGIGVQFIEPTAFDFVASFFQSSSVSTIVTQVGPPIFVALVLMMICSWWGKLIQINERRAIIGFLWGIGLYTLLTFSLFAGYEYGLIPYITTAPSEQSFAVAFVSSVVPYLWYAAMYVGFILTILSLALSSFSQPRIPPRVSSYGQLTVRWIVAIVAIVVSLYVFGAASHIAPLMGQSQWCKYQYKVEHQQQCLSAVR